MGRDGADFGYLLYDGNYADDQRSGEGVEYEQKGYANYEGLYVRFTGQWENGSWKYGKWYACDYDAAANAHVAYLYYEGEFNSDGGERYGAHYRYYNEETGQYEVKTGWFVNWTLVREA